MIHERKNRADRPSALQVGPAASARATPKGKAPSLFPAPHAVDFAPSDWGTPRGVRSASCARRRSVVVRGSAGEFTLVAAWRRRLPGACGAFLLCTTLYKQRVRNNQITFKREPGLVRTAGRWIAPVRGPSWEATPAPHFWEPCGRCARLWGLSASPAPPAASAPFPVPASRGAPSGPTPPCTLLDAFWGRDAVLLPLDEASRPSGPAPPIQTHRPSRTGQGGRPVQGVAGCGDGPPRTDGCPVGLYRPEIILCRM